MTPLSQKDPRWANMTVGTGSATFAQVGCTLTSIAMILGTTPDVVNEKLKAVNGFANDNLVIWAKISEAFPGTLVQRVWSYNNDDVLANIPVVVQVDGAPIGGTNHFVTYIGNHQLADPWDGQIKPTSTYTALSYAIIKPPLVSHEADYQAQLQNQIAATNSCQSQLKDALDRATSLQEDINSYITRENSSKVEVANLRQQLEDEKRYNLDLKAELEKVHKEDKDYGVAALEAQHLADQRKDLLQTVADSLNLNYDPTDDKKLVDEILAEVISLQKAAISSPEETTLQQIIKLFHSMGINTYLESKGIEPIDLSKLDTSVVEKVQTYLTDVANELLALNTNPSASAPLAETIKPPKVSLKSKLGGWIIKTLFITA